MAMATVVVVHSALGLDSPTRTWAQTLRNAGHEVVTPDLFDGRVFTDVDEAVAYVDGYDLAHWVRVAADETADVRGPRVYAGFSLGASVAEFLALTQPDATGMILMHSATVPGWLSIERWPDGVTGQLHYAVLDPWMEEAETAALVALAGPALEVFEYEGARHLFAFQGYREYDEEPAELLMGGSSPFSADEIGGCLVAPDRFATRH